VLVQHGAGVSIIDQVTARCAAGRVMVKPFEPSVLSGFSLVTSNQHPPSQLAEAFVEFTKQRMIEAFGD
ncbi:MAG: LysR family transcriptional regulator, partial [Pandoraea sp.]|nr:LysR family transcriptional regulator [Pandoraea sp.]